MLGLMTTITAVSMAVTLSLSIHHAYKENNWRATSLHALALLLIGILLHVLLGFPFALAQPTPRGGEDNEIQLIAFLYVCLLLGMFCQFLYERYSKPRKKRKKFDWGLFLIQYSLPLSSLSRSWEHFKAPTSIYRDWIFPGSCSSLLPLRR